MLCVGVGYISISSYTNTEWKMLKLVKIDYLLLFINS
jgi:hypothetical protein